MMKKSVIVEKSSPVISADFSLATVLFEITGFFSMDFIISDIFFWAETAPGTTYWEFPEVMTSRRSLWQICLAFLTFGRAGRSVFRKAVAVTGIV